MSTCCGKSAAGQPCEHVKVASMTDEAFLKLLGYTPSPVALRALEAWRRGEGRVVVLPAQREGRSALHAALKRELDRPKPALEPALRTLEAPPPAELPRSVAKEKLRAWLAGEAPLEVSIPELDERLTLEDPFGGGGQFTPAGLAAQFAGAMWFAAARPDLALLRRCARALGVR